MAEVSERTAFFTRSVKATLREGYFSGKLSFWTDGFAYDIIDDLPIDSLQSLMSMRVEYEVCFYAGLLSVIGPNGSDCQCCRGQAVEGFHPCRAVERE